MKTGKNIITTKYRPILIVPAIPKDDVINFLQKGDSLELQGEITKTVWKILSNCNGYNSVGEIAKITKLKINIVKDILLDLASVDIICDSCDQYLHFHKLSNNPNGFMRYLSHKEVREHTKSKRFPIKVGEKYHFLDDNSSDIIRLSKTRKSCRSFSKEKLTRDQIGNICSAGYNLLSHHAVASGGGLYPLKLFVIVSENQENLPAGYYEYDAEKNLLVLFDKRVDHEQLKYCFNSEILPFNSSVQIVISVDISRQPYKYSNRGYRLSLMEAGSVAQNISLYCVEQNLASCQLGGVLDDAIKTELSMAEQIFPLLGIAIGFESNEKLFDESKFLEDLESEFVGKNKLISSFGSTNFANGSFFGAFAKYGDCEHDIAGGTSPSIAMSNAKAIIEAYERYQSLKIRDDIADSSGIAAYTDFETAESRALLELIERDALMRKYFERKSPEKIAIENCPIHVQKRAEFWKENDRELFVLNMNSGGVITTQVVIVSENFPCFVSGASCSDISFEKSVLKALQEAEYSLLHDLENGNSDKKIAVCDIKSPSDHGLFYKHLENLENIKWLWSGKTTKNIQKITKSISQLKRELDIKTTDLSDKNSSIKVVRVESEKLVPISFGYNAINFSHPAFYKIKVNEKSKNMPHYFA